MATTRARPAAGAPQAPETPKRGRGRPEFQPTKAQREKVTLGAMSGIPICDMAAWLGISEPTLVKHFRHEMTVGVTEKRMEIMKGLTAAAKRGNVSAAKTLLAYTALVVPGEPNDGAVAEAADRQAQALGGQQPAAPAGPAEPLGKKAQAAADAKTAHVGNDWGAILPPPPLQ